MSVLYRWSISFSILPSLEFLFWFGIKTESLFLAGSSFNMKNLLQVQTDVPQIQDLADKPQGAPQCPSEPLSEPTGLSKAWPGRKMNKDWKRASLTGDVLFSSKPRWEAWVSPCFYCLSEYPVLTNIEYLWTANLTSGIFVEAVIC